MKAAVVHYAGQIPVYDDFETPKVLLPDQRLIRVKAAALSHITRGRAMGKHYSSGSNFPFVAGVDGVGVTEDGQRVYFALPRPPFGAMAEEVVVMPQQCIPLPDDIGDVMAAALINPGMSSWMALRERASFQPGETVLVNGATGSSGSLAVQIARHMGAKRVIATGRNQQALNELLELGANQVISLVSDEVEQRAAFEQVFAEGVDVVLDYLWGVPARIILESSRRMPDEAKPLRFVQIGSMAGDELPLLASLLRFRANVLLGSGSGSVPMDRVLATVRDLLASSDKAGFGIETETAPLSDVSSAWTRDTGNRRLVITP